MVSTGLGWDKSVALGMYWLSPLPVFSIEPRCDGHPASPGRSLLDAFPLPVREGVASQFSTKSFPRLIEDPTTADAIGDRITAGAIVVSLTGESMRRLRRRAKG